MIKAAFLNCTLKKGPEPSNTRALMDEVIYIFSRQNVSSGVVRLADFHIAYGVTAKEAKMNLPSSMRK